MTKYNDQDTHSYQGWLNSDYMYKRALAIYGHSLIAVGILLVGYLALAFAFGFTGALFGWL